MIGAHVDVTCSFGVVYSLTVEATDGATDDDLAALARSRLIGDGHDPKPGAGLVTWRSDRKPEWARELAPTGELCPCCGSCSPWRCYNPATNTCTETP